MFNAAAGCMHDMTSPIINGYWESLTTLLFQELCGVSKQMFNAAAGCMQEVAFTNDEWLQKQLEVSSRDIPALLNLQLGPGRTADLVDGAVGTA